jgi:hypothetical protein
MRLFRMKGVRKFSDEPESETNDCCCHAEFLFISRRQTTFMSMPGKVESTLCSVDRVQVDRTRVDTLISCSVTHRSCSPACSIDRGRTHIPCEDGASSRSSVRCICRDRARHIRSSLTASSATWTTRILSRTSTCRPRCSSTMFVPLPVHVSHRSFYKSNMLPTIDPFQCRSSTSSLVRCVISSARTLSRVGRKRLTHHCFRWLDSRATHPMDDSLPTIETYRLASTEVH